MLRLSVREVRLNAEHAGLRWEKWGTPPHLTAPQQAAITHVLLHVKCPVCGASPRTGVVFGDQLFTEYWAYAFCYACEHMERT